MHALKINMAKNEGRNLAQMMGMHVSIIPQRRGLLGGHVLALATGAL